MSGLDTLIFFVTSTLCFIHASLKASPKAKAIHVPRAYLSGLG